MFTGDTQDLLAGIYDTPNRELQGSQQGRWLSPDPAGYGWNQYAYPTNPNSQTDPLGLAPPVCSGDGQPCPVGSQNGICGMGNGVSGSCFGSEFGSGNCNVSIDGVPSPCGLAFGSALGTLSGNFNYGTLSALAKVVSSGAIYNPPTSWTVTSTLFDSEGNQIGDSLTTFGVQTGGWSLTTTVTDQMYSGSNAANNGNFSWWGAFASNLFSWKNFTNEFKQGGCVGVFVDAASEGGILPDLPAGHGVEDAVTDASKMAAATYAVNQGLVVPLRSSVVRGILDLGETSASGLVLADTYAKIGAGGLAEYNAIKNGDCH
jgi:RHS repeat-associated protein